MRVLVTGGSGFIGTNMVQHWIEQGDEVVNFDIRPPRNKAHQSYWQGIDLLDKEALIQAMQEVRPDCVIHLAARTDLNGTTVQDYWINTVGVENLIAAAKAATIPRVLFASSQLVCTPGYQPRHETDYCPLNPYGVSKVEGENIVRAQAGEAFAWTIFRPTSIWGPWFEMPYRNFFETVRRGRYVQAQGIRVQKSFGFVGNAVCQLECLARCSVEKMHGEVLYLADYEPVVVSDWANLVQQAWDAPPIREVPLPFLQVAAKAGDMLKVLGMKNPPITSYRLHNLMTESPQDMAPLKRLCGPMPFSVSTGTDLTVAWIRLSEAGEKQP
jgi:nucleoside-diphosphate-sugar epimerase